MRYSMDTGPSVIATPIAVLVILGNVSALIVSYLPAIEAVLRVLTLLLSATLTTVVLIHRLRKWKTRRLRVQDEEAD